MKYKEEIDFLQRTEKHEEMQNKRTKVSDDDLLLLKNKYPNIPPDYLAYLQEIGSGSFREGQFIVAYFLFQLDDLGLGDVYTVPSEILFFGDNFSGDFAGFDLSKSSDEVVEFWHDSEELYYTGKSFHEYIREQMIMGENGEDLRE